MTPTRQALGGYAKAKKIRDAYLASPNRCPNCGKPILPKEGQQIKSVKRKKFCSQSCANTINNRRMPKRKKAERICSACSKTFTYGNSKRKFCDACLAEQRESYGNRRKSEVARRILYAHAASVMNGRLKQCQRCDYSLFVDICHIRPVRDFPATALVREINDPKNLIYLCPNCHHEHDAGLFMMAV